MNHPGELTAMLGAAGLVVDDVEGIAVSQRRGPHWSEDGRSNYLVAARGGPRSVESVFEPKWTLDN